MIRSYILICVNFNKEDIAVLERNSIQDEGARAIADAIKINTRLLRLCLCTLYMFPQLKKDLDDIGAEGAIRMAEAIEVNTTLKELSLRNSFSFKFYKDATRSELMVLKL